MQYCILIHFVCFFSGHNSRVIEHNSIPCRPIGEICYRSQSPDEEALVNFAKKHGAVLEFRDHTSIHIKILHQSEKYDIIKVLGFNSSRKRMSIIVKAQQTGQIYMYTKGADDVIMSRLSKVSESIAKETSKSITEFALEGLRTLCIAMKSLTQEEYDTWERELNNANMAIHNRDVRYLDYQPSQ